MYKNRDWFILAPAGVIALALAVWGFSLCPDGNCAPESFWSIAQKAFGLLRGVGNYTYPTHAWQLVVAQYLVPGIAIYAAAKMFMTSLRQDIRVAYARRSRDHTIVCGLGDTGRHVLDHLAVAGERAVVIDLQEDSANVQFSEQAGIPVIKGNATSIKTLELAGIRRCRALVVTTGNDATNFEIALRARQMGDKRKVAGTALVLTELRTNWLFDGLSNHPRAVLAGNNVEIRPFNIYENAVRLLYRSSAFGRRRRSLGNPPVHLVLVGFGRMGIEILSQGIRTHFALPGPPPRFTIIDGAGEAALANVFYDKAAAKNVADITVIKAAVDAGDDFESIASLIATDSVTAIVVAMADDDLSLSVGVRVRNELDRCHKLTTPVLVHSRQAYSLGKYIGGLENLGPLRHRLVTFGSISEMTNTAVLLEQKQDILARAVHAAYLETIDASQPRTPSFEPWGTLPEVFKQSNRRFADFIGPNMRAVGMRLQAAKEPTVLELREDEVEALARNEHWRWCTERRLAGWRFGDARDNLKLHHPALRPWEELPAETRERNKASVRGLPDLLKGVHVELLRERVVFADEGTVAAAQQALAAHGDRNDEYLVIALNPTSAACCDLGRKAAGAANTSVWLLLTDDVIAQLARDAAAMSAHDIWNLAEGWIDSSEIKALSPSPAGPVGA